MVKTKTWIIIISAIFLLSLVFSLLIFLRPRRAGTAEIYVDGELIRTVDLNNDETFTVDTGRGVNTVLVSAGRIRVIDADCPDRVCVKSGWLTGSAPIVCLPHRLVISFSSDTGGPDAVAG